MQDALLATITVAAVVRSVCLVVGLVRVIPVHLRATTRPAEEDTMAREFGDDFARHAGHVGRLLPKWHRSVV